MNSNIYRWHCPNATTAVPWAGGEIAKKFRSTSAHSGSLEDWKRA